MYFFERETENKQVRTLQLCTLMIFYYKLCRYVSHGKAQPQTVFCLPHKCHQNPGQIRQDIHRSVVPVVGTDVGSLVLVVIFRRVQECEELVVAGPVTVVLRLQAVCANVPVSELLPDLLRGGGAEPGAYPYEGLPPAHKEDGRIAHTLRIVDHPHEIGDVQPLRHRAKRFFGDVAVVVVADAVAPAARGRRKERREAHDPGHGGLAVPGR